VCSSDLTRVVGAIPREEASVAGVSGARKCVEGSVVVLRGTVVDASCLSSHYGSVCRLRGNLPTGDRNRTKTCRFGITGSSLQ